MPINNNIISEVNLDVTSDSPTPTPSSTFQQLVSQLSSYSTSEKEDKPKYKKFTADLTISISGKAGSGKTSLARAISLVLANAGFDVKVREDKEEQTFLPLEDLLKQVHSKGVKILINTHTLHESVRRKDVWAKPLGATAVMPNNGGTTTYTYDTESYPLDDLAGEIGLDDMVEPLPAPAASVV